MNLRAMDGVTETHFNVKSLSDTGTEQDLCGRPALVRGASKYTGYTSSSVGWFSVGSFPGLETTPVEVQRAVIQASNNCVTKKTWKTYESVINHLERCEVNVGKRFIFPMDEPQLVVFVGYLLSTNRLKSVSIENILSALRMYHLSQGFYSVLLRPQCVKNLLRGRAHQDALEERDKPKRLPVTLGVLELLRLALKCDRSMASEEKLVIWAIATVAFHGGFRLGELLSKKARSIDPAFDLQKRDVRHVSTIIEGKTREILVVNLKCPKETSITKVPIRVEVFGNSTKYCPVTAYANYVEMVGVKDESSAAFRVPRSGNAFRHARMNESLKRLLQPHISYGSVTGHSFRAGMATMMGLSGFTDEEIQARGRWSSSAFLRYIKLGRVTKARWADRLTACIERAVSSPLN